MPTNKRSWGWYNSNRRQRLPQNWTSEIVPEVKRRAMGICEWILPSGIRCPRKGRDVDHKINNDDHSYDNLQLLCPFHHDLKTKAEAAAGRAKFLPKRRPTEGHPSDF